MKGKKLGFITGDEPDQWMPRILTGTLGDAADVNLDVLENLTKNTPHQFWLNADPSPITVDLIESLSGQRPIVLNLQRQQKTSPVSIDFYQDGISESGNVIGGAAELYGDFIKAARMGSDRYCWQAP